MYFSRALRETDTSHRTGGCSDVLFDLNFATVFARNMVRKLPTLLCAVFFLSQTLSAHQTSDSYLAFWPTNNTIAGRWAIALRDFDHILTIDADKDGEVADDELVKTRPGIENYAISHLQIQIDGQIANLSVQSFDIEEHTDTFYAVLGVKLDRFGSDFLITYTLFHDVDPLHRGLFRFDLPSQTLTTIFSPREPTHRFTLSAPQPTADFARFVREGVWHIWIGFDHILFLIALLLPSVLKRESGQWLPLESPRVALLNVIKVVTAFTIAHSITPTLATLQWLTLPGRLVESVIALSVALAALNNIKAIFPERLWLVAFAFGLVHGFGFAGVLRELGLQGASLAWILFGFNLGVELGQLVIVLAFVPIAFALRQTNFYRRYILYGGSTLTAAIALIWFCERATDRSFLPF